MQNDPASDREIVVHELKPPFERSDLTRNLVALHGRSQEQGRAPLGKLDLPVAHRGPHALIGASRAACDL